MLTRFCRLKAKFPTKKDNAIVWNEGFLRWNLAEIIYFVFTSQLRVRMHGSSRHTNWQHILFKQIENKLFHGACIICVRGGLVSCISDMTLVYLSVYPSVCYTVDYRHTITLVVWLMQSRSNTRGHHLIWSSKQNRWSKRRGSTINVWVWVYILV